MIGSLRETFPDCRIIGCVRDPLQTVPSLLNSMKDGGKVFGNRYQPENFQEPFLAMLSGYYEQIFRSADVGEIQISHNDAGRFISRYLRRFRVEYGTGV